MPELIDRDAETLTLHFHGTRLNVISNCTEVLEFLARDFETFTDEKVPDEQTINITARRGEFNRNQVQGLPLFKHLGGKAYGWRNERWVDYGTALLSYHATRRCGTVESKEVNPLYHYTYYLIISTLGVVMDQMGLHRLHALGVSYSGRSALLMMPISGGKSTLAMQLLRASDAVLISEDTPLIGSKAEVFPFAIRLSLRNTCELDIADDRFRVKNDPVFGIKYLLDISHFGMSRCLSESTTADFVFIAEKSDLDEPALIPMPGWKSLLQLLWSIGMGKDCPQRAEMVLRLNASGIFEIAGTLKRRIACAISLWQRVKCYRFIMTKDIKKNANFLESFLSEYVDDGVSESATSRVTQVF